MKNKGGRPELYKEEYCDRLIDHMACLGQLGFPDHFVDKSGNVYTRKIRGSKKAGAPVKMKTVVNNKHGREAVMLRQGGIFKNFWVHRLVAIAFISNPDNKPQVNHIDGNPLNNHVSNLEWNTAKENTQHAFRNNLVKRSGVHNSQAKLDDIKVVTMKTLMLNGARNKDLATAFGVKPNTVSQIRTGKSWAHVKCGDLKQKAV